MTDEQRERAAQVHEEQAMAHRAAGQFEAAARWDDYARAIRLRGTSSGVTANGTAAAWTVVKPQVSYLDV